MKERIKSLASKFLPEAIEMRRHLHRNPELSFNEFETSKYVCNQLDKLGIAYKAGYVKTGIVAHINGNATGKVVALRADLDALPIKENSNADYCSINDGVMHACGHDVHTTSLLGAARILNELRNEFTGTVKLIFQPGEEKLPGGASMMIKEKALENPNAESIIGQHVFPQLEVGKVGFRAGMYMASTDEIYVTVKGKGGHAALPHLYVNPVQIAARLILELQDLIAQIAKPGVPHVLAFGKVIADGATNIIPDEVSIEGTFRTMDEDWRKLAHKEIRKRAAEIAAEMGGSCDFNISVGYPYLVNDESLTNNAVNRAIDYLGAENVVELEQRMTAEDFAYYSQIMPGCFYRLGVKNEEKGISSGLHTDTFDVDENCLEIGMGLMAWLAVNQLS